MTSQARPGRALVPGAEAIDDREEAIITLVDMGYSREQTTRALKLTGGDVEQAVGYLLLSESTRDGFLSREDSISEMSTGRDSSFIRNRFGSFTLADAVAEESPLASGLQEMVRMGYNEISATHALQVADGDFSQAVQYLLMGESRNGFDIAESRPSLSNVRPQTSRLSTLAAGMQFGVGLPAPDTTNHTAAPAANSSSKSPTAHGSVPRMVATRLSADTLTNGTDARAFCMLVAAAKFSQGGVVNSEFLQTMIETGIELYTQHRHNGTTDFDTKLTFQTSGATFGLSLSEKHEPKHGVFMADDLRNELNVRKLLVACRNEQTGIRWQLFILENKLECICICMPPKGTTKKFWYFDSIPRSQFRVPGAYARVHDALEQLLESIECIMSSSAANLGDEHEPFSIYTLDRVRE